MTIEDLSSNKNTTNLREGLVSESNNTRLNVALTDENRPGDRQRLTSSPAETAYTSYANELRGIIGQTL